jgi:hypothetical protein
MQEECAFYLVRQTTTPLCDGEIRGTVFAIEARKVENWKIRAVEITAESRTVPWWMLFFANNCSEKIEQRSTWCI